MGYYSSLVIKTLTLTPTVRAVRLSKPPGFDFRASQAVRLIVITSESVDWRPMSIASSPVRPYLELVARISVSPFKQAFSDLGPGDQVGIQGPMGHFFLDTDQPAVLVAGGIGITPFKSMIDYASDLCLSTPITLIYANSTLSEIAYKSELDELSSGNLNFDVIYTINEPDPNWEGRTGYINNQLLREAASRHDHPLFYLAGPPGMVAGVHRELDEIGVPENQIRYDMWN